MAPRTPSSARVLFDEAHGEAWSVRPAIAGRMQPKHPADSSYADAAAALADRSYAVAVHAEGPLDAEALAEADVLVIAHPSEDRWERTVGGSPRFAPDELDAIVAWVHAGGGLIALGETEQDKYGSDLNALLGRFGLGVAHATVYDYEAQHGSPSWILAEAAGTPAPGAVDLLARVGRACFYRAGTLSLDDAATAVLRTSPTADPAGAPLMAVRPHGAGRVVVFADSDLFGDDCLGDLDHRDLWLDTVAWAAGPALAARPAAALDTGVLGDPHWHALRGEVDALRLLQAPDGAIDTTVHEPAALRARLDRILAALAGLAPRFAHQSAYLDAVAADLGAWADGGYGRPAFDAAQAAFRPEQQRADGVEHLVLFPMYTQNGSRDTRFEALVISVPWPRWLAELEAERYDNAKFVPVRFVGRTAGYDSECATLFPETFAVTGRPDSHFGAIFCDREAERFRRVAGEAVRVLGLSPSADAAALLSSPSLAEDAFVLWDLIHDRTHARGDLPFDPFMIRQRMPYWMYALEELRCDLTAFGEAVVLEGEGMALARHVQDAILFDRLFRFPVTGPRVRNYDGLGGQLLFAFLHDRGALRWTDNRLRVDVPAVPAAVLALRAEIEALYRDGIDLGRVAYWLRAHELVSRYVAPDVASVWAGGAEALRSEPDPKVWIDAVRPDEFPLSVFYTALQQKLAPVLAPVVAAAA